MPDARRDALLTLAGIVALVAAVALTTPITTNILGFDADGRFYAAMAGEPLLHPSFASVEPWCYRVLTPKLASLLPWRVLTNFRVVAFASDVASLLLVYLVLRALSFDRALARVGVLLYGGVFWALKFSFHAPAYIDHQTQSFLLLIVWLSLRGGWRALIPVLALAALQKESLALFALFAVARLWHAQSPRRVVLALALLASPVVALLGIRLAVDGEPGAPALEAAGNALRALLYPAWWLILLQSAFSGLGVLAGLLLLAPRASVRFLREEWPWAVYAGLSLALLLGGMDKARLFLYFLPLAVVLAVRWLASQPALRARLPLWALAVVPIHFFLGGYLTPLGSTADYLDRFVPEHAPTGFLPWLGLNLALAALAVVATLLLRCSAAAVPGPPR